MKALIKEISKETLTDNLGDSNFKDALDIDSGATSSVTSIDEMKELVEQLSEAPTKLLKETKKEIKTL